MAKLGDDWTKTAAEAAQTTQEAARRYVEETATLGHTMLDAWNAATKVGLQSAFLQQSVAIQISRAVVDAAAKANNDWLDQTAESMRQMQDSMAKMVAAGADLMNTSVPSARP